MKALSRDDYRNNLMKFGVVHGKVKIDESLFESYTRNGYNDLILLKNGMSLEILSQYRQRGVIFDHIAAITQNSKWSEPVLRTDAEITISKGFEKTKFEIKNASVIIHSKNEKVDNISLVNPEKSSINFDKDDNDDISLLSDKYDLYIGNEK